MLNLPKRGKMENKDIYQQKAIHTNGNILLIASAGSGKTTTIIQKIDYLISQNLYKEKEILVISFTNKSVQDLKNRIKYHIDILTFHKLAINILKYYQINYKIAPSDYLEYITKEFFYSLTNIKYIKEILLFYKEHNYNKFLCSNKFTHLIKIITTYIKLYKTNNKNIEDIKKSFRVNKFYTKYIFIILNIYNNELNSSNLYDFDDLITISTKKLNSFYKYKYIMVDEFQDTSLIRWNLLYKLLQLNKATLFAVGDDFQSIYNFSGCSINLFLNIKNYIPNISILKLENNYRNSEELNNIATSFILKNKKQKDKKIHCFKHLKNPIKIIYYFNDKIALYFLLKYLKNRYSKILILGRNNFDINPYSNIIKKYNNIEYLTIHKSKGLENDVVIIINLTNNLYGFPNKIINEDIINNLHPNDSSYLYAEERRLFYVALTRTKNEVYLLTPFFNKSIFIKEIKHFRK